MGESVLLIESIWIKDLKDLELKARKIPKKVKLLILLGICQVEELQKASHILGILFPETEKIGLTVSAAIRRGVVLKEGFVLVVVKDAGISINVFSSFCADEVMAGKEIGNFFSDKKEGFLLLLTDGVKTLGENLVKEIKSKLEIPLIGAKASSYSFPAKTALFHNEKFGERGSIAVYFGYRDFKHFSIFDWREIGREFLVTKSEGNRVYSINHFPAVEFYKHYLGDWVVDALPDAGVEFPLILRKNGKKVARACIEKHEDGSLSFAGRVPQAAYVKLGCGDLINRKKTLETIKESVGGYNFYFLFPCMARWKFLKESINEELEVLKGKESIGFFTFGEYYEDTLLNETLTVVALEKNGSIKLENKKEDKKDKPLHVALADFLSRISEEYSLLSEAIDNNDFGILIFSNILGKLRCIYASKSLENITGYQIEDFILGNVNHNVIVFSEDREKINKLKEAFKREEKKESVIEYRIVTIDGKVKWIRSFIKKEHNFLVLSMTDISAEKRVEYLSLKDPLTGLYNRRFGVEQLFKIIERNKREGNYSAVLFLDVDKFKFINDVYSHNTGDKVLRIIARRIENSVRKADIVCRFGGDEFIVILPNLGTTRELAEKRALMIAERILEQVSQPILVDGKEFIITTSIGAALFSSEVKPSDAIKFADLAMYESKEKGRKKISIFTENLKEKIEKRENVERLLKREVINRNFRVVYQPLVNFTKKPEVYGFEALVRFVDKELSKFPISYLIEIMEENGIIDDLTFGVIEKVCMFLKEIKRENLKVSVNLSYRDLIEKRFIEDLEKKVNHLGLAPSQFILEVTERIFVQDFNVMKKVLSELREKGFSIAIDDFGSGYSCLSYLQELPVDIIKVDKTFIRGIDKNEKKKRLVEAINFLGKSLDMDVIAEGVESKEELMALRQIGISRFQGYYFSRPLEESFILQKHKENFLQEKE